MGAGDDEGAGQRHVPAGDGNEGGGQPTAEEGAGPAVQHGEEQQHAGDAAAAPPPPPAADEPPVDPAADMVLSNADLIKYTFRFLSVIDICRTASVCRLWRAIADSRDFWSSVVLDSRAMSWEQVGGHKGCVYVAVDGGGQGGVEKGKGAVVAVLHTSCRLHLAHNSL